MTPDAVNDNDCAAGGSGDEAAPAGRKCPICGKPSHLRWLPFCSRRCADVDLHRWLSGSYAIPALDDPLPEDEGDN